MYINKNREQLGVRSATEADLHAVVSIRVTGDGTGKQLSAPVKLLAAAQPPSPPGAWAAAATARYPERPLPPNGRLSRYRGGRGWRGRGGRASRGARPSRRRHVRAAVT